MRRRRETVEYPCGTLKMRMGATHFLIKTLPKVPSEMALIRTHLIHRPARDIIPPLGGARFPLTFHTCDVTGELASNAFMRWGREKQNSVSKYPVAVSNQGRRAA